MNICVVSLFPEMVKKILNFGVIGRSEANGKKENIKNISKIIEKSLLTPLEEARIVIEELIIPQKLTLDLLPQNSQIRKLQHEIINHYRLKGISIGDGKNRRVRIYSN